MKYRDALALARLRFSDSNSARLDAEFLLQRAVERDRASVLTHLDEELTTEQAIQFEAWVARRARHEPIQYILGETEFYGLPFRVTPDVLIPRPETEHLIERVAEAAAGFSAPRIVDVGTGSGAIAVTLAKLLPQALITSIDISAPAVAIAQENAARNGVEVRLLVGDLLAPVEGERFEMVVSNPPYVPLADRASLSVEVREFEPKLALFAGDDGLDIYRRLIPAAWERLVPGGLIALEIGYGQQTSIAQLLNESGFEEIVFTPDLQGIARVACGRRALVHGV